MSLKQTRARQIRIRLVGDQLAALEHYAKLSNCDVTDYLIWAGLEIPLVLAAQRDTTKGADHESDIDVQQCTEVA